MKWIQRSTRNPKGALHLPEWDRNRAENRGPAIRLDTTLLARALVL